MLNIDFDKQNEIAVFEPDHKFSESDFKNATNVIDPYIEEFNHLNGLIISTKSFPGWDSFSALLSHLSFVKKHLKKIVFVAFVTDSPIGRLAEHVASYFVSAKKKSFKYSEIVSEKKWIIESHVK